MNCCSGSCLPRPSAFPADAFGNALYENPGFGNDWLKVRLIGTESNTSAIGARVRLTITEDGEERDVYGTVRSGGSFGASSLTLHMGVGSAEMIDRLEVLWPRTRKTQAFTGLSADRHVTIFEGKDELTIEVQEAFLLDG